MESHQLSTSPSVGLVLLWKKLGEYEKIEAVWSEMLPINNFAKSFVRHPCVYLAWRIVQKETLSRVLIIAFPNSLVLPAVR